MGYSSPKERFLALRRRLAVALDAKDHAEVEECFRQLLASLYRQPLSSDELISVAACMLGARNHDLAVRAYLEHLRLYPQSARNPEICFRLGILFSRRFHDYDQALKYLALAAERHTRSDRVARAQDEMRRIRENLARLAASPQTFQAPGQRAWVVRQTDEPINITAVGRLVAREAGLALADVTTALRRSRGVILEAVPVEVARRVAQGLQAMGVAVLVIGEEDLISLPEVRAARRATLSPDGVRFEVDREVLERPWSQVYFVAAGQLEEGEPARIESSEPRIYYFHHGARSSRRFHYRPSTLREFLVLDFFLLEPWQRVRVEEGRTRCEVLIPEGALKRTPRLEEFVQALTELAPDLSASELVHLMAAGGYQREVRRFRFDSELAFDSYCQWLLQLEEHNRPPGESGA